MSSNNRNRNNQGYNNNNNRRGPQQTYARKPISSTFTDSLRQPSSSRGGVPEISGSRGGSFVIYLPEDEAVASGLGGRLDSAESQRVVDLLNSELSRLLRLKPAEFWKEVATDSSLHTFLESFLRYRSRWYDFPHRRGGATEGISGESELCRRVFMVLYRILSYSNPTALLQEKKLLDLPKLLDICALYGRENEDVTRSLVKSAIKAQPWLHKEFTQVSKHFLNTVHTMYQRCTSSTEKLVGSDYLEVMDFINDAVVNLDAFVAAYNPAAVFFCSSVEMSNGNEELLATLGKLHDALLPSLERGLRTALASETSDDFVSDVFTSVRLLSGRIVNLGWKLLNLCYLGEEAFHAVCPYPEDMFPASMADPMIRTDILVQKIRAISHQCSGGSFLQNIEKRHQITSRVESLQNTGWFSFDYQQKRLLSDILGQRGKSLAASLEQEQFLSSSSSSSAGISIHEPKASAPGRFTGKAVLSEESLDVRDEEFASKNSKLIKQMGYEDEYDDSFDDLGLGVGGVDDSGTGDSELAGSSQHEPVPGRPALYGYSKKKQFFVKDGKNYSYKVPGSIPVRTQEEAALVIQAEADSIYGFGRGGNAGRKWTEAPAPRERVAEPWVEAGGGRGRGRGNMRGGGRGRGGRGNAGAEEGGRGQGRGGGGGGRHDRKNQAAKK